MKFITITIHAKVPAEDCIGCNFTGYECCRAFPLKDGQPRVIYNNKPCKQCREARAVVSILKRANKMKW